MAEFPANIPTFIDLDGNLTLQANNHTSRHNKVHAEIVAIAAKVGTTGSAVTTSLEYRVTQAASSAATNASAISSHTGNTSNPHSTTKAQVGLGNVDNTSDATKQLAFLQAVYGVGSIYFNVTNSANPATIFGFGTWVSVGPYVLAGYNPGDSIFGTAGTVVGSVNHWHWQTVGGDPGAIYAEVSGAGSGRSRVITVNRAASGASSSTNGSREDGTYDASSIQPSLVVYMWQRTA